MQRALALRSVLQVDSVQGRVDTEAKQLTLVFELLSLETTGATDIEKAMERLEEKVDDGDDSLALVLSEHGTLRPVLHSAKEISDPKEVLTPSGTATTSSSGTKIALIIVPVVLVALVLVALITLLARRRVAHVHAQYAQMQSTGGQMYRADADMHEEYGHGDIQEHMNPSFPDDTNGTDDNMVEMAETMEGGAWTMEGGAETMEGGAWHHDRRSDEEDDDRLLT